MKAERATQPSDFVPVTLTLTFETQAEIDSFTEVIVGNPIDVFMSAVKHKQLSEKSSLTVWQDITQTIVKVLP
jgi:hypothetical protein